MCAPRLSGFTLLITEPFIWDFVLTPKLETLLPRCQFGFGTRLGCPRSCACLAITGDPVFTLAITDDPVLVLTIIDDPVLVLAITDGPVLVLAITGGPELVLAITNKMPGSVSDVLFLSPLLRYVREDKMSPVHIIVCICSLA